MISNLTGSQQEDESPEERYERLEREPDMSERDVELEQIHKMELECEAERVERRLEWCEDGRSEQDEMESALPDYVKVLPGDGLPTYPCAYGNFDALEDEELEHAGEWLVTATEPDDGGPVPTLVARVYDWDDGHGPGATERTARQIASMLHDNELAEERMQAAQAALDAQRPSRELEPGDPFAEDDNEPPPPSYEVKHYVGTGPHDLSLMLTVNRLKRFDCDVEGSRYAMQCAAWDAMGQGAGQVSVLIDWAPRGEKLIARYSSPVDDPGWREPFTYAEFHIIPSESEEWKGYDRDRYPEDPPAPPEQFWPDRPLECPECGQMEHSCHCGYFAAEERERDA